MQDTCRILRNESIFQEAEFVWPEAFPVEVPAVHRPKERRRRKKPKRRIEMDRVMSLFHAVSVVPD